MRTKYETVANAIDDRNKFKVNDWSDPALLTATNTFVQDANDLASSLEDALHPETAANVRSVFVDYIAGLRALSISERNHAKADQLNGVGLLYNQVLDAPLKLCGIPS